MKTILGGLKIRKYITSLVLVFILLNIHSYALSTDDTSVEMSSFQFTFSLPQIIRYNNQTRIVINETNQSLSEPGYPLLPKIVNTISFPKGTKISSVSCQIGYKQLKSISQPLDLMEIPLEHSEFSKNPIQNASRFETNWKESYYPKQWLSYKTGSGLDNDTPVLFLSLSIYPVHYCEKNQSISSIQSLSVTITYQNTHTLFSSSVEDPIDLLIIGPEEFFTAVQPLILHKQSIGLTTQYKTVESIYQSYSGRDRIEQIKYAIEDMVSSHNTKYVLLIGSIYHVPIRISNTSIFGSWHHSVLSDLYYADLYDANGTFSSWDTNNDGIYGETDVDTVDLYPDVHVGRLACESIEEVSIVVDKIMVYELNTFGEEWYRNMVFIGGNTFTGILQRGNEGEKHNQLVMEIMDDFNPSAIIWTSKHNFNPVTISRAITKGAGFVDYSGHGFEHGMGTYSPHGRRLKCYLTPYVSFLRNGYELPVIFFDACLTAKLDFVLQDVLDYKQFRLFDIAFRLARFNTSIKLPCYAWSFVKHDAGGAIATIGATRTAFGGEDFGCEKLSTDFFSAYERGIRLGQMFSQAQTSYIHDLPDDQFTVEEFVLLGDPSLQLGGYSDDTEPPTITIQNPVENAIHFKGVPLFSRFITLDTTRVIGGFKRKPVQILVEDNIDEVTDINVYLEVDGKIDTKLEYNKRSGCYETEWTGFGWNLFSMNITAVDLTGNKQHVSVPIIYHCLFR